MEVILNKEVFGSGRELVFIHGWAAQNGIWRDWAQQSFAQDFRVNLIELPGFGESPKLDLDKNHNINSAWLDALEAALPDKFILVGWSLGGLMAQQLALKFPERVEALVCLSSSPKFMRDDDWQKGISPELLVDFFTSLSKDSFALLKKFWRLQMQGEAGARKLMRAFVTKMSNKKLPSFKGLWQGLELLRDLDLRDDLADITTPTCWIFGELDPLVPLEVMQEVQKLQPLAKTQVIDQAGHTPFLTHPDKTADLIRSFIESHG